MLKSLYYIAFLSLITMTSCEKEAQNITYPNFKQKIVLASFISPNDSISYVNISSNYPIFGELNLGKTITISNAKAYISDGSHEIQLDSSILGFKFYHKKIHIEAGKSYIIRVEADNGLKAEASCKVPEKQNFNQKIDTISESFTYPDGYMSSKGFVKIKFTDVSGEANYYIISILKRTYLTCVRYDSTGLHVKKEKCKDEYYLQFKNNLFNDLGKESQEIEITSETQHGYWKDPNADSAFITFYLLNINKDFYKYQQSLNNYTDNADPFTEVSPAYSNVIGGLGIFAGYTKDSVVFRLK